MMFATLVDADTLENVDDAFEGARLALSDQRAGPCSYVNPHRPTAGQVSGVPRYGRKPVRTRKQRHSRA